MAKLTNEEVTKIVEKSGEERRASVKNFFTGMAKAVTTDLPGFLMDVADKLAGDTTTLGEKDRSAQLFEKMTGIKTKSGSGGVDELIGSMVNPISSTAVIVPAFITKKLGQVKNAQQMLDTGNDVSSVFEATGIYPSVTDDILRTVISDEGAKLKYGAGLIERTAPLGISPEGPKQRLSVGMWENRTLGQILDHPELFKAIPELQDVPVGSQFGGWESGAFSPESGKIFMGATRDEATFKSILLHETQHAIQNRFGMTQGGNSGMFYNDKAAVDNAIERLRNVDARQDASPVNSVNISGMIGEAQNSLNWANRNAFDNYLRLEGEAEARAVQELLKNPSLSSKVPLDYYPDIRSLADVISGPEAVPKVDESPAVKAIIEFMKRNPEFGKTKP